MKICPFVSHLLGDDNTNALTIDNTSTKVGGTSGDVVALGYDDEVSPKKTKTKAKSKAKRSKTKARKPSASHLFCLKESCRFYHSGDCQFDMIFNMLEDANANASDASKDKQLAKDIEKIWQFQTKSVAELIESLADSEKNNSKALEGLKKDVEDRMESLASKIAGSNSSAELSEMFDGLRRNLDDRNDGIEDLSTTMSDVVINLQDSIEKLRDRSDAIAKRFDGLKLPSETAIRTTVEKSVADKLSSFQMPDITGPIERLSCELRESIASAGPTDVDSKFERSVEAQREMLRQVEAWNTDLTNAVRKLQAQQDRWESRFEEVTNRQNELLQHLQEGKEYREKEQARSGKKEAKKFNNLGVTSFHNGAFEMARDQFLEAVAVDPDFAEAFNNMGLALTELGEEEEASKAFQRAIELNPSLHAAYNNLGYVFFKQGNYTQAIEMYNEALGRSTNNSSAYTNLGNAYYKLDKRDEAESSWKKALEIDPSNDKAKRNLDRIREEVS